MPLNEPASAYSQLSAEAKGVVDTIIFGEVMTGDSLAWIPQHPATLEQKAYHALMTGLRNWSLESTTPDLTAYGEQLVEERRELYAANPTFVANTRTQFNSRGTTDEEMIRTTALIDRMIAIDGDQHEMQRDLPKVPGHSTPQR